MQDSIVLSNIQFMDRTDFRLSNSASATVGPDLTEIIDSTWVLSGQSVLAEVPDTTFSATYTSTGLWSDDGCNACNPATFPVTLMQSSGEGTLLDLSGIQSIDAGFNSTGNDNDRQKINALDGGVIDLSEVQWVQAPNDSIDRIEFNATNASAILLDSLTSITSIGAGDVRFTATDSSEIRTGGWEEVTADVTVTATNGSEIRTGGWEEVTADVTVTLTNQDPTPAPTTSFSVLGNLRADADVAFNFNHPNTLLDIDGSALLGDNIDLLAPDGAVINIGGDFLYTQTNPELIALGAAAVHFDGSGTEQDPQVLEVGGWDVEDQVQLLPDHNFGFGQMVVGQPDQATTVRLQDFSDNHLGCEALYLWRDQQGGSANPALVIHKGSTLILDEINLYVCDGEDCDGGGADWQDINELFDPPKVTEIT